MIYILYVYIASINGRRGNKIRSNINDAINDLILMMRDDHSLSLVDVNIIASTLREKANIVTSFVWFKAFNGSVYAVEEVPIE